MVTAIVAVGRLLLRCLLPPMLRRPSEPRSRTLLTLEGDYSLNTIRSRGFERIIAAADLDGFFEHVWTVHPLVGADPVDAATPASPRPTVAHLNEAHTVVEGHVEYAEGLRWLPGLNFALAQAVLVRDLQRLIRRERIGVVRASEPFYLGLLGLVLARANGIPFALRLIANYDSGYWAEGRPVHPRMFRRRSIEKRIDRFVLRRADLVAAGNADILGYALANGADEARARVILLGGAIDDVHFRKELPHQGSAAAELSLEGRPFAVCVTRLEEMKHPEDVLRVVAQARNCAPELAGVLVGDGSMRPQLESLARELGIEAHLVFAGNRDQEWIADLLRSAAVVLSPLTGRALIEAALSASAIVAYDVDWHSELVRPDETGILVPYRDTEAMAKAVCELLADRLRTKALGANARALALEMMDPAALIAHERAEYAKL